MIEVRHIDDTCLQVEAFMKLCKKYSRGLKKDILIVFDKRVKYYGTYILNNDTHLIRISLKKCLFDEKGNKLDDGTEKYHLISTFVHEIFHARQKEELGVTFESKRFSCTEDIENVDMSEFYSKCEVEARAYENKHVLKAVEYYDSCCV